MTYYSNTKETLAEITDKSKPEVGREQFFRFFQTSADVVDYILSKPVTIDTLKKLIPEIMKEEK
jgi:hypothetical protein